MGGCLPIAVLSSSHLHFPLRFRGTIGELNEKRGIRIGPDTIASRWSGETMDYNIAIGVLLAARSRVRDESVA